MESSSSYSSLKVTNKRNARRRKNSSTPDANQSEYSYSGNIQSYEMYGSTSSQKEQSESPQHSNQQSSQDEPSQNEKQQEKIKQKINSASKKIKNNDTFMQKQQVKIKRDRKKEQKPLLNDIIKNMIRKIEKEPQKKQTESKKQWPKEEMNKIEIQNDSKAIRPNDHYKPKSFSQPFNILKVLYLLDANIKPVTNEEIMDKYQKAIKYSQFRHFKIHKQRLSKNGFISLQQENEGKIKLMPKGVKFIAPKMSHTYKEKDEDSIIKVKSQIQPNSKEKKPISNSQKTKIKSEQQKKQLSNHGESEDLIFQKSKYLYFKDKKLQKYPKQALGSSKNADKMRLIINPSAFANKFEYKQFNQQLNKDGGLKVVAADVVSNIHFLWEVQGKVLDCFATYAQGLKTDFQSVQQALAESKYCNSSLFFLIFQEQPPKQDTQKSEQNLSVRKQRQKRLQQKKSKYLNEFILNARAAGYIVVNSKNLSQTITHLRKITAMLIKKIKSIPQTAELVHHYGRLEKLNQWFRINKKYNLRRIIIRCLKKIKNMTLQGLKKIAGKLPTFGNLFNKMSKLDNNYQRIKFMDWFLKSSSNQQTNTIIVGLLFLNDYKQYDKLVEQYKYRQNLSNNQSSQSRQRQNQRNESKPKSEQQQQQKCQQINQKITLSKQKRPISISNKPMERHEKRNQTEQSSFVQNKIKISLNKQLKQTSEKEARQRLQASSSEPSKLKVEKTKNDGKYQLQNRNKQEVHADQIKNMEEQKIGQRLPRREKQKSNSIPVFKPDLMEESSNSNKLLKQTILKYTQPKPKEGKQMAQQQLGSLAEPEVKVYEYESDDQYIKKY